ncbi:MAG: phosphate/phosphite/phosphonate ABC transporter substrate-binding protein [Firmicutes bacterium]|nr:phosphate/phosphite/phosphonate ABC transporter substrate-binding protein [Bacillota bacterium]
MFDKRAKQCFGFFFLFMLAVGLFAGCRPIYPELKLNPPENLDTVTAPTPNYQPNVPDSFGPEAVYVRLAVAPVFSPLQTRENYLKLLAYLSDKLEQPVELVLRSTYAEIDQLLKQSLADIAFVGSRSYIELEKSGEIELLAIPQIKGQNEHHSYIIVPDKSNVYSLEDLRGEKFLFTDPLSFPGKLYVLCRLSQMGKRPETFFSDTIYSYSNDSSVIAVTEGWVRGAAVDSVVYNYLLEKNPELEGKTRIIETSPAVGNPPIVVSSSVPVEFREKLKDIFSVMHNDIKGREALAEMGVECFVSGNDENYDVIRRILAEAEEGSQADILKGRESELPAVVEEDPAK